MPANEQLLQRLLNVYGNDTQSIRHALKGIKANKFDEGGDKQTLDDYIQAKRDSIINSAVQSMLIREKPEAVFVQEPIRDENKKHASMYLQELDEKLKQIDYAEHGNPWLNYYTRKYPDEESDRLDELTKDSLQSLSPLSLDIERHNTENERNEFSESVNRGYLLKPGFNCINTVTASFGDNYRTVSNKDFYGSPESYGFTPIDINDVKRGDLIQLMKTIDNIKFPFHAMLFDSYDNNNGTALFDYSNGTDEMRKKAVYSSEWGRGKMDTVLNDELSGTSLAGYRFIGTPDDIQQWEKEYESKYGTDYGKGGKIYIKPSHRGRFTSLLKRTGKSASWFKAHGTPAQKKMATFALNARKWKHEDGGPIHRAISSNKADVVLAAIRKMKSDVTP